MGYSEAAFRAPLCTETGRPCGLAIITHLAKYFSRLGEGIWVRADCGLWLACPLPSILVGKQIILYSILREIELEGH